MKRVFPVIWFGVVALFLLAFLAGGLTRKSLMAGLFPIGMAAIGYFMMKTTIWNLADEVYDCGEFLLVRIGGEDENVALSNIINVSATRGTNPPRITLRLASPGKFGNEIAFSPITNFTLNPFAKNPIAEDLIVRVDRARAERRN